MSANASYVIGCRIEGGARPGARVVIIKDEHNQPKRFSTRRAAQAVADTLTRKVNANPAITAAYQYWVIEQP